MCGSGSVRRVGDAADASYRPCPAGFQCIPTVLPTSSIRLPLSYWSEGQDGLGVCMPCKQGQFCPENTTNFDPSTRLPHVRSRRAIFEQSVILMRTASLCTCQAEYNICPPGYTCDDPTDKKPCPAGRYCALATSNGGYPCNILTEPLLRETWATWTQGIYCEPKVVLRQGEQALHFLCRGGYYCPNAATRLECPEGSFCPDGVKNHTPCMEGT